MAYFVKTNIYMLNVEKVRSSCFTAPFIRILLKYFTASYLYNNRQVPFDH